MALIYAMVARGTTVLAEYTTFAGNFTTVAKQLLDRCSNADRRLTITSDNYTFNYLIEAPFVFCVVSGEGLSKEVTFSFLEKIREDFTKNYLVEARTSVENGMNQIYRPKLKYFIEYYASHPDELSKIQATRQKVTEVQNIIKENIDKVLERQVKLEVIEDKADALQNTATTFQKQGTRLRRNMWWQNMKMKLCVLSGVIILGLILFGIIYGIVH